MLDQLASTPHDDPSPRHNDLVKIAIRAPGTRVSSP